MNRSLLAFFVLTITALCSADPWKLGIQSNFTLGLNMYSDNWTGGDVGNFTWTAQLLATAERQFNEKINNKNTLKLAFGQTKTQDPESKRWSSPQKSSDLIDFESILKLTLGGWVDPYIAAHVVTQFIDEYYAADSTKLDKEGNPIDITESFGAARAFVKNESVELTSRLGGAFRQNVDRKRPADSVVTNDGGIEFITDLKAMHPSKIITYTSRLSIYEALFRINPDTLGYWRHPDVNWENTVAVNVAKYLMISFTFQMLYDIEKELAVQMKETLAAGLTFTADWPKAK